MHDQAVEIPKFLGWGRERLSLGFVLRPPTPVIVIVIVYSAS